MGDVMTTSGGRMARVDAFVQGRVSRLAMAALVLAVLLFLPGLAVPGPGIVAATLGVVALLRIGRAHGRLRGRMAAAAAILLGAFQTMVAIGLWIGAAGTFARITETYGPALAAVEAGDEHAFAQHVAPDLANDRLPAAMDALREAYSSSLGSFDRMPRGVAEMVRGMNVIGWRKGRDDAEVIRLPGHFTRGTAGILFRLDPSGSVMPSGARRISNLGVELPEGKVAWLAPESKQ